MQAGDHKLVNDKGDGERITLKFDGHSSQEYAERYCAITENHKFEYLILP